MNYIKLYALALLLCCYSIGIVKSQNALCDPDNLPVDPANLPLPPFNINMYSAFIERNDVNSKITEEIIEYYDGTNDIAIAVNTLDGIRTVTYSYAKIDELLLVSGDECKVFKLSDFAQLTPFEVIQLNGKPHILPPLSGLLTNPDFRFKYTGQKFVRGVAVNEWQACYYDRFQLKANLVTVTFTNPDKWTPISPQAKVVPVQMNVTTLKDLEDVAQTSIYTVTSYKPFVALQEEDYFTPSGVYCPGRQNIKALPKPTSSFFVQQEVVTPGLDITNRKGNITKMIAEYNYDYKLFQFFYIKDIGPVREIHDYNTGLKYEFDMKNTACQITKLEPNNMESITDGTHFGIKDPAQLFAFDSPTFQYIGVKRVDGVNTNVWTDKKKIQGLDVILEWYFLGDTFNRTDDKDMTFKPPILIKIIANVPNPQNPATYVKYTQLTHLFNFRQTEFNLNQYDISLCSNDISKRYFTFALKNDLRDLIRSNEQAFKESLTKILQKSARVTILRLFDIQIRFSKDEIHVFFTLFERSSFYGNVTIPQDDLLSDDAVQALSKAFKNDAIQIDFSPVDVADSFIVPADKDSFQEIGAYDQGYVYINIDKLKDGYSPAVVAIITIIVTIVGLILGLFINILQKNKKINLPVLSNFAN